MKSAETLIDDAVKLCNGQAELARRLGMRRQDVHGMASGQRPISARTIALLCDVLEVDSDTARTLVAQAIIEAERDQATAARLQRALFLARRRARRSRRPAIERRTGQDRRRGDRRRAAGTH